MYDRMHWKIALEVGALASFIFLLAPGNLRSRPVHASLLLSASRDGAAIELATDTSNLTNGTSTDSCDCPKQQQRQQQPMWSQEDNRCGSLIVPKPEDSCFKFMHVTPSKYILGLAPW